MSRTSVIDQLDKGIEALLSSAGGEAPVSDTEVAELLALAAELRALPRPDFKAELKAGLLEETMSIAYTPSTSDNVSTKAIAKRGRKANSLQSEILPALAGSGYGLYPVQRSSFMASLVAHAAMLALLVTSGIWAAPRFHERPRVHSVLVTDLSSYVLPPAPIALVAAEVAATPTHCRRPRATRLVSRASKSLRPRSSCEANSQSSPPSPQ